MSEEIAKVERPMSEEKHTFVKPRYEVLSKENAYHVKVYMPGVSRGDAKITLDGDDLTIEASRASFTQPEWKDLYREIEEQDYKLHLQLNVEIDSDGITAKSDQGVLTVVLPIAAKVAQRTIPVA